MKLVWELHENRMPRVKPIGQRKFFVLYVEGDKSEEEIEEIIYNDFIQRFRPKLVSKVEDSIMEEYSGEDS